MVSFAQGGQQRLTALFTFVARDALTGQAYAINPVQPQTAEVGQGGAAMNCRVVRPGQRQEQGQGIKAGLAEGAAGVVPQTLAISVHSGGSDA
jgi:hypothetical protein